MTSYVDHQRRRCHLSQIQSYLHTVQIANESNFAKGDQKKGIHFDSVVALYFKADGHGDLIVIRFENGGR